ncbi:hypothetical protein E4T02_14540 [Listeria monocytogenes]|uniref:hypothetical protein n=1 Tax=Listeria TaxID=1637 RepID=UPI0010BA9491|nr:MULTISPECIES: hypothetical protein [Listeria]EAE3734170.1 hypothetical protein [Listeria monocytogenes]EAE3749717.1 hypothetical protein [Listeria monocytogenes]EAE5773708.1 hypothetical protein [Listeria monocytogenes]EAE6178251.1 hypothetical protein [Listeria monocytogenes]EAE6181312.1 hypothetical protein [Listeria monocytogenes]
MTIEEQAFQIGVNYKKKQLISKSNYQTLLYKLTNIVKKGDKELFLATLLEYSKERKIPSFFEENDLQEEKVFKAVGYGFIVGLTQN